jgi:hypothetical protein
MKFHQATGLFAVLCFFLSFHSISQALTANVDSGALQLSITVTPSQVFVNYTAAGAGHDYDIDVQVFDYSGTRVIVRESRIAYDNNTGAWALPAFPGIVVACQAVTIHVIIFVQGTGTVVDDIVQSDRVSPCGSSNAEAPNPCADGRINTDNCSAPIAIYFEDDVLTIYGINSASTGVFQTALDFADDDFGEGLIFTETNSATGYSLHIYLLGTGELQIETRYRDGKAYILVLPLGAPETYYYLAH